MSLNTFQYWFDNRTTSDGPMDSPKKFSHTENTQKVATFGSKGISKEICHCFHNVDFVLKTSGLKLGSIAYITGPNRYRRVQQM